MAAELVPPTGQRSVVRHEPVGPVSPPLRHGIPHRQSRAQTGRADCRRLLGHPEIRRPRQRLAVLQCLLDAGLPPSVGQAVFGVPDQVSATCSPARSSLQVSFTGSTVVGKHLMRLAADNMLRTTMELGGHGPVLVFDDADLERVLDTAVPGKYRNAGQVCVSPTRFIVQSGVYDAFRTGFAKRAATITVGNGLEDKVQMGPMAGPRRPMQLNLV